MRHESISYMRREIWTPAQAVKWYAFEQFAEIFITSAEMTVEQIQSVKQTRMIADMRKILSHYGVNYYDASLVALGTYYRQDHSTIAEQLAAYRKLLSGKSPDPLFAQLDRLAFAALKAAPPEHLRNVNFEKPRIDEG